MPTDDMPTLITIKYPEPDFNIRMQENKRVIWDRIRKRYVALTGEEWVRQNFLRYLITEKRYPGPLMAVEKEIRLGPLKKRCDIVVYKDSAPWMIIECKEPGTPLNGKTLLQILGYNMTLKVPFLILTNGDKTYGVACGESGGRYISGLPEYP